jgi:N-acetylneuraminate synthase
MSSRHGVRIGGVFVGDGHPCYVTAEIGINHNGSMEITKKLIDAAKAAGCQAVKFQKRTIEVVYTPEELAKPRENPFGATNGDLKRGLEFGLEQYKEIDEYCREKGIHWFASPWDELSVAFLAQFNPVAVKIASASLTDDALLRACRLLDVPVILSTGMSTMEQIRRAVDILGQNELILLHCTSTYPGKPEELNLRVIQTLRDAFPEVPIGYSGHEVGLATSVAAVALGACMIERHITLDRAMFGSDQASSVEPGGFVRMVNDIRSVEAALGDGQKVVYPSERPIIAKLRRVDNTPK